MSGVGRALGANTSLEGLDLDVFFCAEPLQVTNVRHHAALFPFQLLHVASALGAARDTIRDITVQIQIDAVRATLGQGVTADLAHLASVASLASAGI